MWFYREFQKWKRVPKLPIFRGLKQSIFWVPKRTLDLFGTCSQIQVPLLSIFLCSPRGLFPLHAVGVFQSSIPQNVTSTCTCWRRSKSDFPYIIYPPVTSLRILEDQQWTLVVNMSQKKSLRSILHNYTSSCYLIQSFWTNVIWTILWILPVVLQFNFWVAKPHIHQHRIRIPSPCHHCFVNEFSGRKAICGKTSNRLSDPFKGLSDLQLGDEKVTLNHLASNIFFQCNKKLKIEFFTWFTWIRIRSLSSWLKNHPNL